MLEYTTNSPEETLHFGNVLGNILQPGMVILLYGDLGAGKTCLAGGILKGLGINEYVTSPTFTLVNEYFGRLSVAHFDLYRLDDPDELLDIGFEEYFDDRVVLIEWPERAGDYLPSAYIKIELSGQNTQRRIQLVTRGEEYVSLYEEMKNFVSIRN